MTAILSASSYLYESFHVIGTESKLAITKADRDAGGSSCLTECAGSTLPVGPSTTCSDAIHCCDGWVGFTSRLRWLSWFLVWVWNVFWVD